MKKLPLLMALSLCIVAFDLHAQESIIRRKIEKDMEKKYADPNRKKGKEELENITYENDKRYADPTNKIQATLTFKKTTYNKKGEVKDVSTDKIIFGKTGECMVMQQGNKDELWWVYDYAGKANYMVNLKDKSAVKMPLINLKKMTEKMAQKEADRENVDDQNGWQATDEYKTINGYNCRKFIYTYPANSHYSKYEAWVSKDVKFNLNGNYIFGARLEAYKFPDNENYKDLMNGFIVQSLLYNKSGQAVSQRDLESFQTAAEEKYFDMSQFKTTDVLDILGGE